ncbi:MAG: ATP phosphoribosyltransferase regulatory subunit [Enterocloster sp.]
MRDSYNAENAEKSWRCRIRYLDTLYLYGYEHIPDAAALDISTYSARTGKRVGPGRCSSSLTGTTTPWCSAPDMTPAVARCVAKYFHGRSPCRCSLCYLERTFKNNSSYQGRLKERAETGAELIGDDSADGDAEMIAMVIDSLKAAGLKEFQVELGQVAFYRSLLEGSGFWRRKLRRS